jgi:hypothetical protein
MPSSNVVLTAVWSENEVSGETPGTTDEDTPSGTGGSGGSAGSGTRSEISGSATPEEESDTSQLTLGGIPLVSRDGNNWAILNLILALLGVALAVVAAVRGFRRRGESDVYGGGSGGDGRQPRKAWVFVSIAAAVLGVILFVLTEDIGLEAALVDKWTIFNAALSALSLAGAVLASRKTSAGEQA